MSGQQRMSAADWRRDQLIGMSEARFQADVVDLARKRGWSVYHPYDSRRSSPGFPDLVLARAGRIIVAELKAVTGRWGEGQRVWLAELTGTHPREWHFGHTHRAGPALIVACWTPLDWDTIAELLSEPR